MTVNVKGQLTRAEIEHYINYVQAKNPRREIESINIEVGEDVVSLGWTFKKVGFERIRRITGYLVGSLSRFNDAKQAEVRDRVKHSIKRDEKDRRDEREAEI